MNSIGKMISSKKNSSEKIERLSRIMNYRRTHGYKDGFALMPFSSEVYRGKSHGSFMRFNKVVRQLTDSTSRPRAYDNGYAKDYINEIYSHSLSAADINNYNRLVKSLRRSNK